ncbi:MAG: type I polyketide synthase, partial [Pirellulaceae bacterium]
MEPTSHTVADRANQHVVAALLAAKTKLEQVRQKLHEPLAVIGVGCRFPGATGAAGFWDLLQRGHCPIRSTPQARWDETLLARREKELGKITANQGGFLDDVDLWDASFFGVSPREAASLDPQQRLLLSITWEALEHAGIDPDHLRGSRTGVFIGICSNDYLHRLTTRDISHIDAYLGTGNAHGAAAGRLSYYFNWQGPSTAVDTACSSSLVAVHLAARSLRSGDCDMAVVGGVNLMLTPELSINLSQAGMLSPTGRCQAFAAEADGFVRGEGCGVVLLKRLSDAQAAGDTVLCLLRGSAVNQDGRSNGLTAPNALAQQAVIRQALADAQLTPQDIDYVEAHGTGTALGDPIEMGALGAVFAPARDPQRPLLVGSVKTNIGHLEGAAGIAGLIKVGLALAQHALPPHLHFQHPSPHIDWSLPLQVPVQRTPWIPSARPRRAGVSSFGFGGTNAHVVLEEAPRATTTDMATTDTPPALPAVLLVLSAKTPTALREQARQFAEQLPADASLADIAYTAAVGRAALPQRLALVVEQRATLQHQLRTFAQQGHADQVRQALAASDYSVAWVLGGPSAQGCGAGRTLAQHCAAFRQRLDETLQVARDSWPSDLRRVLWEDAAAWQHVEVQPALVVLQVALGRTWRDLGLEPRLLLGYGLGEYAAACLAGVLTLADTLRLVTARAQVLRDHSETGGMPAVSEADDAVRSQLSPAALDAFHAVAQQLAYRQPQWPYVSGLTGTWATDEVATPDYWCRHLRQPVRSHDALRCAAQVAPNAYLEIGAGNTLAALVHSSLPDTPAEVLPGLQGDDQEWTAHLTLLGRLFVGGASLAWPKVWGTPRRRVVLPSYPFQRQRYWFTGDGPETAAGAEGNAHPRPLTEENTRQSSVPGVWVHPLLGWRLDLASREIVYETDLHMQTQTPLRLRHHDIRYLADHCVAGTPVLPATGYLELALAAGRDAGFKVLDVRDVKIRRPLALADDQSGRVQVVLTPDGSGFSCRILQWSPGQWSPG